MVILLMVHAVALVAAVGAGAAVMALVMVVVAVPPAAEVAPMIFTPLLQI
jgi:hypothetical protein